MKSIIDYIIESRGDAIDEQWLNDEKPVMNLSCDVRASPTCGKTLE